MESFHWVNRDGMTSKVMFHVLVHVNKLAARYHDSNFRFVELSKNTKRPHFLWVSRPKPVPKPEIRENDEMMFNSDRPSRKISNFHLISFICKTAYDPKIMWFQPEPLTPSHARVISGQVLLKIFGKSVDARLTGVRTLYLLPI